MKHIDDYLLEQMAEAMERKQEAELKLIIAEREYEALLKEYKAVKQYQGGETV